MASCAVKINLAESYEYPTGAGCTVVRNGIFCALPLEGIEAKYKLLQVCNGFGDHFKIQTPTRLIQGASGSFKNCSK